MDDDLIGARASSILQQTLLGDAAEHAEVGVFVWNEERRYVALNDWACKVLGRSRAELLGSQVGDSNPVRGPAAIEAVLEALPARDRIAMADGKEMEWLCVRTDVAGIAHIFGLLWPAD